MKNKKQILFLILILNIFPFAVTYSQVVDSNRNISIIDYQIKTIKGKRIEKIHYLDSIYYLSSTQLELTGEYIITRTNMVKTDSTPINQWKFWNNDGKLNSIEIYGKEGKINQLVNYHTIFDNLIVNPGFEMTDKSHIIGWSCVYDAQIKYYNINNSNQLKSDAWIVKTSAPRTGDAFVELNIATTNSNFFVCPQFKSYRYIQGELRERLIRGELYYFEFYIKHNPCSKYSCNNLGVYFGEQPVNKEKEEILDLKPFHELKEVILADDWIKIQFEFEALEYYKYFIIGNFNNDKKTKVTATNKVCEEVHGVYTTTANYFLDDFSLVVLKQKDLIEPLQITRRQDTLEYYIFDTVKIGLDEAIPLKNIFFEFDSYKILPESVRELNRLLSFLMNHKNLIIEISGYTDNIGDSNYNKILSLKRAEAVCQYLIDNGIEKTRLISKGYGSQFPIVVTDDLKLMDKNRRVEFKIIKTD